MNAGFTHNSCMANIRELIRMLKIINCILSNYIDNCDAYNISGIVVVHDFICKSIFRNSEYLENTFEIHDYAKKHGFTQVQSEYGLLIEKIKNKETPKKPVPRINYDAFR